MEQSEENLVKTELGERPDPPLPKPAGLDEVRDVSDTLAAPIFATKNVSIYYSAFRAVTC